MTAPSDTPAPRHATEKDDGRRSRIGADNSADSRSSPASVPLTGEKK